MVPVVLLQTLVAISAPHLASSQSHQPLLQVELLSWKSNKDLTGDGGIIKTTVREGNGWDHAKNKDEVVGEHSHWPGVCTNSAVHCAALQPASQHFTLQSAWEDSTLVRPCAAPPYSKPAAYAANSMQDPRGNTHRDSCCCNFMQSSMRCG